MNSTSIHVPRCPLSLFLNVVGIILTNNTSVFMEIHPLLISVIFYRPMS